jgi:hypothetical protein
VIRMVLGPMAALRRLCGARFLLCRLSIQSTL